MSKMTMTRKEILKIQKDITLKTVGRAKKYDEEHGLTGKTSIEKDLGADSLTIVEFFMEVEDKFGVGVTDEEVAELHNADELTDLLIKKGV